MAKIFFDADIIFSLCYSKNSQSGANKVIAFAHGNKIDLLTSSLVVEEVRRNLPRGLLSRLGELLDLFRFSIIKTVDYDLSNKLADVVDEKDAHVLAATIQSQSNYLLTFNKRHFLTEKFKKLNLKLQIMDPKDYIEKVIFMST